MCTCAISAKLIGKLSECFSFFHAYASDKKVKRICPLFQLLFSLNPSWLLLVRQGLLRRSWWRRPTWQHPSMFEVTMWRPSSAGICPRLCPTSNWLVTRWPGRKSYPLTTTTTTSGLTASFPSLRSCHRSVWDNMYMACLFVKIKKGEKTLTSL